MQDGFGTENNDRENRFMHYCFPEKDRQGVLGDADRTGISLRKEIMGTAACVVFLIFILVVFFEVEFSR